MKRYTLYILVAILGMLNIQPAEAQQKQDALYIFRNDGKFNAFYYADIERIEYSKVTMSFRKSMPSTPLSASLYLL